jgi:aldose 1-epimerase
MIAREEFGRLADGRIVSLYTLRSGAGITARICDFGALLSELHVPDRDGRLADVVLGFDTLAPYLGDHPYFGATVGRVANRIAEGRCWLDGQLLTLDRNASPHHLHGGRPGFSAVPWHGELRSQGPEPALALHYLSPAGEAGYPGTVAAEVVYTLASATLRVEMSATTDQPTLVNLAHHSYWNLDGHDAGSIVDHELAIAADLYTPTGPGLIPTGALSPVDGTPYDFRRPRRIGDGMRELGAGYDLNFALRREGAGLALAARLHAPASGRTVEVRTTAPGLQLYTGNFTAPVAGKSGVRYQPHQGLALETQAFPDAPNHEGFPSIVLRPGACYRHVVEFALSWG